jgi:hypothetical protein
MSGILCPALYAHIALLKPFDLRLKSIQVCTRFGVKWKCACWFFCCSSVHDFGLRSYVTRGLFQSASHHAVCYDSASSCLFLLAHYRVKDCSAAAAEVFIESHVSDAHIGPGTKMHASAASAASVNFTCVALASSVPAARF